MPSTPFPVHGQRVNFRADFIFIDDCFLEHFSSGLLQVFFTDRLLDRHYRGIFAEGWDEGMPRDSYTDLTPTGFKDFWRGRRKFLRSVAWLGLSPAGPEGEFNEVAQGLDQCHQKFVKR